MEVSIGSDGTTLDGAWKPVQLSGDPITLATLSLTGDSNQIVLDSDGGVTAATINSVQTGGPKTFNMKEINELAIDKGIAFVPGEVFYSDDKMGKNCFRLNFTMISPETIEKAIKILGNLFKSLPTE